MPVTKKEVALELAQKDDLILENLYFPVSKKVYENLIKCGAFDSLYKSRKSLLDALPKALEHAQDAQKERESGQLSLFGDLMEESAPEFEVPYTGDWSIQEQMKQEKIALGLYLTDHPITAYKKWTSECATTNAARAVDNGEFRIAGMATYYPQTNKIGKPYGRLILEDQDGSIRVNFYGKTYDAVLPVIQSGGPMIVHLEKTTDEKFGPSYRGLNATSLLSLQEDNTTRIKINVPQKDLTHFFCQDLATLLLNAPGECPVDLELKYTKSKESATFTMRLKQTVNPTETLLLELKKFVGDAKKVTMINR
jgi:DNA polymerase-3 subunit alpha